MTQKVKERFIPLDTIVHKKNYDILFHQLDAKNHVKPYDLCCIMQDAAADHTISIGLGLDTLQGLNSGIGWVLSHQYISFEKAAFGRNGVEVTTWSPGTERLFAVRDYIVTDHEKHCIAKSSAFWLMIDLSNNKIVRPDEHLADMGTLEFRATDYRPKKIKPLDTYTYQSDLTVSIHDIDLNNHANNASIVRWMIDGIPSNEMEGFIISELMISYQNQAQIGTHTISKCEITFDDDTLVIHHLILSTNSNEVVASGISRWSPADINA